MNSDQVQQVRIQCLNCSEFLAISAPASTGKSATAKNRVNELLVDFGWLPTTHGPLCRIHSRQAREVMNVSRRTRNGRHQNSGR